jgi:hypothetical protein
VPHHKAIDSSPELFALLVENREAIPLLTPFAHGNYDINVGMKTDVAFKKYYHCSIQRVFPIKEGGGWLASGNGDTLIEAVRAAVTHSDAMRKKWGE